MGPQGPQRISTNLTDSTDSSDSYDTEVVSAGLSGNMRVNEGFVKSEQVPRSP